MIPGPNTKSSGFPVWLIPPVMLIIFTLVVRFNGLYGQDSFEYLRYSRALHAYFQGGILPGPFFWPVLYPLTGSICSFFLPDILSLQLISIACYGFTSLFLMKILRHLFPEKQEEMKLYLLLFFCLSPFILRYSVTVMSEPMTLFFITAFFYYYLVFIESIRHKYFLGLVFFGCAAINTRYPAFMIVGIPFLHAFYLFIRKFRLDIFLFSILIMVLLFLPAYLLDLYKQGSIFGRLDLGQWSIVNYFRSSFMSPDGFHSYLLPNICFVFSDLIHPGIIFSGLFFLILIRKKHVDTLFMRSVILVILVYAFFLAGLTFQNDRVLILTFPLVLILFSGPYLTLSEKITKMIHPLLVSEYPKCSVVFSRRGSQINRRITQKIDNVCFNFAKLCVKLCETLRETFIFHSIGQHLKKLAIISLILIQVALFSRAFSPFYRNYRTTRTIAEKMLKYPGKKIYTFNIDMALKGYGVKNETVSLWSSKLDFFEPNALVLFNFTGTRKQWQGMNPMLNWENLNRDHHLKVLEKFPDGWNLYEID